MDHLKSVWCIQPFSFDNCFILHVILLQHINSVSVCGRDVNESLAFETYSEVFNNHTTLYEDVRVNIPYFCYIAVSAFVGGKQYNLTFHVFTLPYDILFFFLIYD